MAEIILVGQFARRALDTRRLARVSARFETSFHIEAGDAFVCVGGPGLGNGPLNAIVAGDAAGAMLRAAPAPGTPVIIRDGLVTCGGLVLDARCAREWLPAWPQGPTARARCETIELLFEIGASASPGDGLAPLLFRPESLTFQASALGRIAVPRIRDLDAWLDAMLDDRLPADQSGDQRCVLPPPTGLLGLGPGLTPSGDDLLCGVLLTLAAAGQTRVRDALAAGISMQAAAATTSLSAAFLGAAAVGQGGEALHRLVVAVLEDDTAVLAGLVAAVGRIGHSSGWDAVAGVALAALALGRALQRGGRVADAAEQRRETCGWS